jgi:hypothetical protein
MDNLDNLPQERRLLRRILFAIRHDNVKMLDCEDREQADQIHEHFNGFLLGAIGWTDFSIKWDIHPDYPECDHEIISLFEWKTWLNKWQEKNGVNAIPPPCFTRQGMLGNGSQSII